jgi:hypothetical protein
MCQLFNDGPPSPIHGDEVAALMYADFPRSSKGLRVTYYRVDFLAVQPAVRPAKRFRTEEKAKQHAKRVLGLADDSGLVAKVAIVAITRDGIPV